MYGEKKELGCLTNLFRYFLMLVNILFMLASVAGVVVSVLLMKDKSTNILKFCKACSGFNTFTLIVFGALFVFSFLGFCALWKRQTCMLMLYAFVQILFFLAALCILVIIVMIHEGKFDKALGDAWNENVKEDAVGACEFQMKLNCTGWDISCPAPETNATGGKFYNATYAPSCPICTDSQIATLSTFPQTCHRVLKDDVNKYFYILLGTAGGLCLLTLLSVIISCKVRVEYEEYEDLSERF